MVNGAAFVDHYHVLRVDPNCDARTLETAYHALAKTYHPDHGEHPDVARLTEVIEAYKAIRSGDKRAEYDLLYAEATGFVFTSGDDFGEEKAALSDADAHARVLQFLYQRRRESAQDAGIGRYYVQQMLGCSDELFEFHVWYLKEKGFIVTTEQGTLAITIEGVDHVIASSRVAVREKLLLSQTREAPDQGAS